MNQGSEKRKFVADEPEPSNKRSKTNQDVVGSALLGADNSTNVSGSSKKRARDDAGVTPEASNQRHNIAQELTVDPALLGFPEGTRMSKSAARYFMRQQQAHESLHEATEPGTVQELRATSSILPSQLEADASTSKRVSTRSSTKRTRIDAGSDSDAGEDLQDTKSDLRRSTRQSKRVKETPEYNDDASDEKQRRIRKISKLRAKIAAGKGPKRGSLAPNGEVRTRKDGKMEFRDVNNPEWTLAAYHNDYRRQFLNEAAQDGQFDHTPTRGEANLDETSYEPEQQSWGPERAHWQNIINSEGVKVMFAIDKPKSLRPPQEPNVWVHNGLVLLDNKNHPVKDWPGLNKTLSTEIESWRWEALTRVYPWLSVADLLARMPHTRKDKGKVVPLQTPQAFTNRSYRFRIPNQIPASKMTNGSATYKLQIIKSLEEQNAKTTETLSTLNPKQVEEVRKINKGKFKQNSRYVTKKDTESLKTPAPSLKRKARRVDDDETESEIEQEKPKAKKPYLPKPYEMGGAEAAVGTEASPGYVYDDTNGNAYPNEGNNHNVPTGNPRRWHGQEPYPSSAHHTGLEVGQSREDLVPLFASIDDQVHALNMDETFTSPLAVILARRHGHPLTEFIYVNWYRQSTPRHVGEDGMMVEDVVDEAFTFDEEAQEPIPSNNQPTLYVDQASINDIPVPVPDSYGPSHGVNPDILARTPSNSLLTPAMGLNAPDYGVYQDTLGQTASDPWAAPAMDLYASNHGIYPGVLRRPNNPPVPPLGPYVPAHNFYPDVVGQPSYPPVTPVENLNAPLPFPNQIGRYRTESDTSEEVWRNHHGSTGF